MFIYPKLGLDTDGKTSINKVLHATSLQTTAWYAPMATGGLFFATAGGFFLHILPGTALMIISATGYLVCVLLFAIHLRALVQAANA